MKRSSVLFTELDRRLSLSNNNQNKRKYKEENKKCRKNRQREKQRDFDKVNNKNFCSPPPQVRSYFPNTPKMSVYGFPSSPRFIEKKIDHFSGVEVKKKWLQCFVHVIQGIFSAERVVGSTKSCVPWSVFPVDKNGRN